MSFDFNANIPLDFDVSAYIELNDDLRYLSPTEAIKHYKNNGIYENRKYKYDYDIIPLDFDASTYIELNNDLKYLSSTEAIKHYIKHGLRENRKYSHLPSDFDISTYIELNDDLKHLTPKEAIKHFLEYGSKENKPYKYDDKNIPLDFDVNTYIELNDDLKYLTPIEGIKHYLKYGSKENKKYKYNNIPLDFDALTYTELNDDLKYLTSREAIKHYENYGIFENRKYKYYDKIIEYYNHNQKTNIKSNLPVDFYWKDYINLNEDLINLNKENAELHYELYGINEKRNYTKNIIYKNTNDDTYLTKYNEKSIIYVDNFDNYNLLILIIDYGLKKGGTNTFLNHITKKYGQYLLIARPCENNLIEFNINDEIVLNKKFNLCDAIVFLKQNLHKIAKIFINHVGQHDKEFIDAIFHLNKKIATITHDFSMMLKITQPLYDEISKENLLDDIYINKCDIIISQNPATITHFRPYIKDDIVKIITELPDYRHSDKQIMTNNDKMVIGIIGNISDIKGLYMLRQIIKHEFKDKYTFIVFGQCTLSNIVSEAYNNLTEFNDLLIKYKPNILLELSIWPETYSYTLTLAKLTQLPILYYTKPFNSTILNRLENYNNSYCFNTIDELYNIIENIPKQNYFYTILDQIYYPKFWDEYFTIIDYHCSNDLSIQQQIITNDNIVLITSKIICDTTPLTYSNFRSVYTIDERYAQLIDTITSIRNNMPNVYIVLFDNSKLDEQKKNMLVNLTNIFLNVNNNDTLNHFTDKTKYKFMGELAQMCFMYDIFLKNVKIKSKNFFKISGRYKLNDDFNFDNFDNEDNIFKKNMNVIYEDYYYTSFYKLNCDIIPFFFQNLYMLFNNSHAYMKNDCNYENIVPNILKDKIKQIDTIGLTQIFGPFKFIDNI